MKGSPSNQRKDALKKAASAVSQSINTPDFIVSLSDRGEEIATILIDSLRGAGLSVDQAEHLLHVRAPFSTLCRIATAMGLAKSLKGSTHTKLPFGMSTLNMFEGCEDQQSFFSNLERKRLIDHVLQTAKLSNRYNIEKLPSGAMGVMLKGLLNVGVALVPACSLTGYISDIFPPHEEERKKRLRTTWENQKFPHIPVMDIKDYFGEKIGFYFAWLEHFTKWLIVPAVLGTTFFILQKLGADPGLIAGLTSILTIIWGTLSLGFWKRRSQMLAYDWKVDESQENNDIRRPQFSGMRSKDPITGEDTLEYSNWYRWAKYAGLSLPLVVMAALTQLMALYVFHVVRSTFAEGNASHILMSAVFTGYGVVQNFMTQIYPRVATFLVDWENYKTEVDHEKHLVRRVFLFNFIAQYSIPLYLIVVEHDIHQLANNLLSLTLTTELTRLIIFQTLVPFAMDYFKLKKSNSNLKDEKFNLKDEKLAKPPSPLRMYLPRVMQLGCLLMFAPAFPIVGLLALATAFLELKSVKFDLMNLLQRPIPIASSSIGNWEKVLNHLLNFSILSHVIILYILTNKFSWLGTLFFPDDTTLSASVRGVIIAVAVEHMLMLIKMGVETIVDRNTPSSDLKNAMRRDAIGRAKLLSSAVKNFESTDRETPLLTEQGKTSSAN